MTMCACTPVQQSSEQHGTAAFTNASGTSSVSVNSKQPMILLHANTALLGSITHIVIVIIVIFVVRNVVPLRSNTTRKSEEQQQSEFNVMHHHIPTLCHRTRYRPNPNHDKTMGYNLAVARERYLMVMEDHQTIQFSDGVEGGVVVKQMLHTHGSLHARGVGLALQ